MSTDHMPQKYTKRPVTIEAIVWNGTAAHAVDVINWILGNGGNATYVCDEGGCTGNSTHHKIEINTLEGDMTADHGDFIIRGVQGEFYPCKPGIFYATYDTPAGIDLDE